MSARRQFAVFMLVVCVSGLVIAPFDWTGHQLPGWVCVLMLVAFMGNGIKQVLVLRDAPPSPQDQP